MNKPIIVINSITSPTEFSVTITWSVSSGPVDGFVITRSIEGFPSETLISLPSTTLTYTDVGLTPSTDYQYTVNAFNSCGYSDNVTNNISTGCSTVTPVFGIDTNVVSDTRIDITWDSFGIGHTYTVQRSINFVDYTTLVSGITTTYYSDITVTPGTCYYYKIIDNFCDTSSGGVVSTQVCSTCTPPSAPNFLLATAVSDTEIELTWTAATGTVSSYVIKRFNVIWDTINTVSNSTISYTDSGLSPGTLYCYQVIATNTCGSTIGMVCDTTYNTPPCDMDEQSFSWNIFAVEPGLYPSDDSVSSYINYSDDGSIDITNPLITGVQFGDSTELDDILVMMKPGETITTTFPDGSSSNGRGRMSCVLPHNCILFVDTTGYYINGNLYSSHGVLTTRFSSQKEFTEAGTTNSHIIVAGKPPGSPANSGSGHGSDFSAAGFTVIEFGTGISLSTLDNKGFVVIDEETGSRYLDFKFAHIVCGYGSANINDFTCTTPDSILSSSSCVTVPPPVFDPQDALCCLTLEMLDMDSISDISGLNINLTNGGGEIVGGTVQLTWINVSGNNGYIIERSVGGSDSFVTVHINTANQNTFYDAGLDLDLLWCYRISTKGCNDSFNSDPSDVICTNQMTVS